MKNTIDQQEKAKRFRELHYTGKLLLLPNIWDCLGAQLLQDLQYPAVATASASVSFTNAYDDGENIPFAALLPLLKRIVDSVRIPVTADIESGFAANNSKLTQNIGQLLQTGIAGINIEDTDKKTNTLLPLEAQCEKIRLIKKISSEYGLQLFINARTDVYTPRGKHFETPELKLEETVRRGLAYKQAGADGFYPIAMNREEDIRKTVKELQMPINVLLMPGVPDLRVLEEIGVARVSTGPGFLKIAVKAMKDFAMKLRDLDGLNQLVENDVTSTYLKELVSNNS